MIPTGLRASFGKIADALAVIGLDMPVFRIYERLQSLEREPELEAANIPPPYYRVLTTGIAHVDAYLDIGRKAADQVIDLAQGAGVPLDPDTKVLEFGCGCGRVLRFLAEDLPVQLHGCDIHRGMVAWCASHLRGRFAVNRPKPPLPYPDASFDLVYALSVFTHLTRPNARRWLAELARVTAPGGVAILSFWDDLSGPAEPFLKELRRSGFHLKRGGEEGSNLMVGFFTHDAFAEDAAAVGWSKVTSVPAPDSQSGQAMMVLRRPAAN
jgi:SAM-dependent methyltransferase